MSHIALGSARSPLPEQARFRETQCLPILLRRGPSTLARRFTSAWFDARAAYRTGAASRDPMFARFASTWTLDARAPVYERLVWRAARFLNRRGLAPIVLPVLLRRGPSTLARRCTSAWFGVRAAYRTGAMRRGPIFAHFASTRTLDARAPGYERLVWRACRLPNRHGTTKPDLGRGYAPPDWVPPHGAEPRQTRTHPIGA